MRENLREHLIATAARMIDQRGSAGLAVRDIASEAGVAVGALYNYFDDKEDLLAHALLAHVAAVMASAPQLQPDGTGTVAANLEVFIDRGLAVLARVMPAFAGLLSQPKVLSRFSAMVGGDAAFGGAAANGGNPGADGGYPGTDGDADPRGLPAYLTAYLLAEQRRGRVDATADVDAASALIIGAIHGQVLPRILFNPPGSPLTIPPGFAARLAETMLGGIAPRSRRP